MLSADIRFVDMPRLRSDGGAAPLVNSKVLSLRGLGSPAWILI